MIYKKDTSGEKKDSHRYLKIRVTIMKKLYRIHVVHNNDISNGYRSYIRKPWP